MLTDFQRDQARYKGGDELKKRKSFLKRSATAIRQLVDEAGNKQSGMTGAFTANELELIRTAAALVDRASDRLASDIREADAIRKKYDKDVAAAHKHLSALPRACISDIVAICAADRGQPLGWLEMDTMRTSRYPLDHLNATARDCIQSLAWICVRKGSDPAEFTADILRRMPDLKAKHADLITELNALAVAQQLEQNK